MLWSINDPRAQILSLDVDYRASYDNFMNQGAINLPMLQITSCPIEHAYVARYSMCHEG